MAKNDRGLIGGKLIYLFFNFFELKLCVCFDTHTFLFYNLSHKLNKLQVKSSDILSNKPDKLCRLTSC